MIKNLGSAEQIRNEILRRLQENADLGDTCDIPLPQRVDAAANGGCNWIIDASPQSRRHAWPRSRQSRPTEMMREYDLR